MIDVVIVDDHKLVRDGIKAMLFADDNIRIVGEASSAPELFAYLSANRMPHILVLDIVLPGQSGLDVALNITRNFPTLKVLILAGDTSRDQIEKAIANGASGFLPKDTSRSELVEAITKVAAGERYFGASLSSIIFEGYAQSITSAKKPNILDELSEREINIIKYFADGFSYKEISDKMGISVRTVESHKKNILIKLNLKNTVELVKYALKENLTSFK